MPQQAWSKKRERQYEHIKGSLKKRGSSEDTAEEIAARTVNKERARSGEARQSSRLSRTDISSGRRGGLRSGTKRPKGHERAALQRGQANGHLRALADDEGAASAGRRPADVASDA